MEHDSILVTEPVSTSPVESERIIEVPSDVATHRRGRLSEEENQALFFSDRVQDFRTRWQSVQTNFVDDPRQSVEAADTLVADVLRELTESFARARGELERQWSSGNGESSTEDLRIALRRYRSFFNKMLAL